MKVLFEVWTLAGEPCGKYLAAIMGDTLAALEAHDELGKVAGRLTGEVRAELVAMSPATIDRYLAPTRAARDRYDTPAELDLLGQLWELVNLRKNYLLPTKKATGWRETPAGRHVRVYDAPRTPYQRLLDSAVLTPEQTAELSAVRAELNPADLTRRINAIQTQLIDHARAKTLALRDAS